MMRLMVKLIKITNKRQKQNLKNQKWTNDCDQKVFGIKI